MGDHIIMSISVDRPSDETLNRGPLVLRRQYEFSIGIDIVQFSFFIFLSSHFPRYKDIIIKGNTCSILGVLVFEISDYLPCLILLLTSVILVFIVKAMIMNRSEV